mgnify:CR=1 FL=1
MKIRNIIFDCNGTMIFDGKYHDIAWRTYVSKLAGRELTKEEFQHQILGHTNRDIFEWLLGKGALSEEKIMQLTEEKEVLYRNMYQEDQDACGQSDRQDHRHKIAVLADAGGRVRNPRLAKRHLYFLHIQHIELLPVAGGCLKNNLTGRHLAVRADLCALYGLIFQIYHELRIA